MILFHAQRHVIPAAFSLLPEAMRSKEAEAMLLAIGLQESGLKRRKQMGGGPARGFWQFELNGLIGVLAHRASRGPAENALRSLCYGGRTAMDLHAALEAQRRASGGVRAAAVVDAP